MPQVGWLCVFNGEQKTYSECIECAKGPKHCEFTPEMLISMRRGLYPRDPEYVSVTRVLGGCLRRSILDAFFDYRCSPRKNYFAFRGNLIHQVLADVRERDTWKEITQSRAIDIGDGEIINIWGTADKIVPSKGLIRDYKTTAMVPRGDTAYGHHAKQLNAYRWLWQPVLDLNVLRLQYIDMKRTKQIKVELEDLAEVERELIEKTRDYVLCVRTEVIPPGQPDSKNWECGYCDLKDVCIEINELSLDVGEEVKEVKKARLATKTKKGATAKEKEAD